MPIVNPNFAARLACTGLGEVFLAIALARAATTTATSTAPAPLAAAESRLGVIHFIPPPGWRPVEQAGRDAMAFVSPDSTADGQAAIVVLLTQPLGPSFDFRARFAKAVENAADTRPITDRGPIIPGHTGQGCDTLEQTFAYKNASGQLVRGRLLADRVGDRLAAFWYLATNEELFKKHADDLSGVLSTVRFDLTPATMPAAIPATLPASGPVTMPSVNPELAAIDREKAELRRRLADLESREKGLNGRASPTTISAAGSIDVTDRGPGNASLRARYPKGTRLVLTLTPTSPPQSAEVRTIACDIDRLPETAHLTGFPPGSYRLTAKAVTPDERSWALKLTTSATPLKSDWVDAVEADPSQGAAIGVTDVPK